jgi:GNAT superfamily N-acetyltransferase
VVTTVRAATEDDVEAVAACLARAFADDPVMLHLFGDRPDIVRRLTLFFGTDVRRRLRTGHPVWTNDDRTAAACWAPPEEWRTPISAFFRTAPVMIRIIGRRIVPALQALQAVEKAHPETPHWYLAELGTDPEHQGKGHGAAVMAPVLDRCDTEGLPAYLESSKERNVPYYRRFGFEVTDEIQLPKGPVVWGMWRDPR